MIELVLEVENSFKSSLCCIKSQSSVQRAGFRNGDEKLLKENSLDPQPTAVPEQGGGGGLGERAGRHMEPVCGVEKEEESISPGRGWQAAGITQRQCLVTCHRLSRVRLQLT